MIRHPTESDARTANSVLDRLCQTWLTRAAVRSPEYSDERAKLFDPALYDYPPDLLPFKNHPAYRALDEPIQRRVHALAWAAWNRRVVDTEELVVCRALLSMISGETDLKLSGPSRMAIRHTLIDEAFHSHMHEIAAAAVLRARGLPTEHAEQLRRPGYSYRSLIAASADRPEAWEADIARLTWAVVGELSIYEFLTIVSDDETIQPGSRELLKLHERDEAAHASVVAQVMRRHFHEFGKEQKACFLEFLPQAMTSLSQQDWLVWRDVLELAEVTTADTIIDDVSHDPDVPHQLPMLRSHRRIEALCHDLDIDLAALTDRRH